MTIKKNKKRKISYPVMKEAFKGGKSEKKYPYKAKKTNLPAGQASPK